MTKDQQKEFISQLIDNVKSDILKTVPNIPNNWDGVELRQYTADMFSRCILKGTMSRSRKQKYNNDLYIYNL